jgi:hypothetical protein
VFAVALASGLACGGGGGHTKPPLVANYVHLHSDVGDYIGAGKDFTYTQADSQISLLATGGHLTISIAGDETWTGDFQEPSSLTTLQAGTYAGLQRYPFHVPAQGGMSWTGEGRGCNTLLGSFTVDSVTQVSGAVTSIDLNFEQHCDGSAPALHGQIHWNTADRTAPPGPIDPPPAGLWQPAAGATPASGNYVYLQSEAGDYVGAGLAYSYTQATALLSIAASSGHVTVGVAGDENWSGNFQTMNGLALLQTGYYGNLKRYPFQNPVRGGLDWSGQGRGCNQLAGWFTVDAVTYSGSTLSAIDVRFEQHCEGGAPALHGKIHWTSTDTTAPPGPVDPPPSGLWQPAAGATPASGNYVYLQSGAGDYIGGGLTYTYTQATAVLSVATSGGHLSVGVKGDENWSGDFRTMSSVSQLQPGYYGNLQRYPFNNPVRGGLAWSGQGRGCNQLTGWFTVDAVTYSGSTLSAIDVRFEQHCEGGAPALHGKIHWTSTDTTAPPGPVDPPPSGLWQPAAGATPATGNYVYLQSDSGDYIGAGLTYTYVPATSTISLSASGGHLSVNVSGWSGDFQTMNSVSQLQRGYYGSLQRYPFHNPIRGGLNWSGQGRGCNTLTGWFTVDAVTYSGSTLTAIDLRFEQHCEGGSPALHGKIHWGP